MQERDFGIFYRSGARHEPSKRAEGEKWQMEKPLSQATIAGNEWIRVVSVVALISVGGALLTLSYLFSSSILTFMGLGLVVWGMLFLYITPSKVVAEEIITTMPMSMITSINTIVSGLGYAGRPVFLHPRNLKGLQQGYVFIPAADESKIPSAEHLQSEKILFDDPKGIVIPAPNQGLVSLFEERLNVNFAATDLGFVQEKVPQLIIENLQIASSASLEEKGDNTILLTVSGEPSTTICKRVSKEANFGSHFGCPICDSFALILSKVTGKPVSIKDTSTDGNTISTLYKTLSS